MTTRILIASPIYQKPSILNEFLASIDALDKTDLEADLFFIDDNKDIQSTQLLAAFPYSSGQKFILPGFLTSYHSTEENNHQWKEETIWKVANYKNKIIEYCLEENYDYLFLIDSDLVLHPQTLQQLLSNQKDIISNIFWTQWDLDKDIHYPQVWISDHYNQFQVKRGEIISQEEKHSRRNVFFQQLKQPGLYQVGGLGACTLINSRALRSGVNFSEIPNINFMGEDRHFCIRAAVLGYELYVDTHYPAFHIYREKDLEKLPDFKNNHGIVHEQIKLYQVKKSITNGFQSFGTSHYDLGHKSNWIPYFTDKMVEELNELSESEAENNLISRLKVTCQVSNIVLTPDQENFNAEFRLINCGIEKAKRFTDHFLCRSHIKFDRETRRYLIDSFEIIESAKTSAPFILRKPKKITLSMTIKNESKRYLERVLKEHIHYIDEAVIIDDCSTDNSIEICESILKTIPYHIIRNDNSLFHTEYKLRELQWKETAATDPDWILNMDSDELFETKFRRDIHKIIDQDNFDTICFRLYDFWSENYYREDKYWSAHLNYKPFLVRFNPAAKYRWNDKKQHSGRFPDNILKDFQVGTSKLRVKHLGWMNPLDRLEKFKRYMSLDPDGLYGSIEQYNTILDEKPNLVIWKE
ncbi:glycosyltransferase [Paenibacillus chitinolyticus]|uniref:glycosyltransferase n=1 Tax=Paenibacillus chitinolyticus TaxID=79263 RepID=UPI001C48E3AA|nr:glycosyltransferase [Paenibacillus chitinolyticus]MBV6716774.1 glycosyltransferase [Paenibacillus chitinolyticus]